MLKEVNHWLDILTVAVDALLLARLLFLKLQRTYFFITLACVVTLFFDAVVLWFGAQSRESLQIFIYSRFLVAFIYPAAAFDVWEELRGQIGRFRRAALFRLLSSLLMAAIFGFLISLFSDSTDGEEPSLIAVFALVLWAASSTASLAFLWSLHRVVRAQKLLLATNTYVWLIFFGMILLMQVIVCFFILLSRLIRPEVDDVLTLVLNSFTVLLTCWCAWRLRPLAAGLPSPSENVL